MAVFKMNSNKQHGQEDDWSVARSLLAAVCLRGYTVTRSLDAHTFLTEDFPPHTHTLMKDSLKFSQKNIQSIVKCEHEYYHLTQIKVNAGLTPCQAVTSLFHQLSQKQHD